MPLSQRDIERRLGLRVSKSGDTMTGFLTLHADPTADLHAVTKQYVDDEIAGVGGGGYDPLADDKHLYLMQHSGLSTNGTTVTGGPSADTGTATLLHDSTGAYLNYATTTSAGAVAGWTPITGSFSMQLLPDGVFVMKTGANASDLTGVRIWVGFDDGGNENGPTPANSVLFRFDTQDAGDTNWMTISEDGSSNTELNNSGVAVAANTRYVLRVQIVSTTEARFYINGALVATHTSRFPAASTTLSPRLYILNGTAGTARNIRCRMIKIYSL